MMHKYIGEGNPKDHAAQCKKVWESIPRKEWTHKFICTLDIIPKNLYIELEMPRDTTKWEYITQQLKVIFTFHNASPIISAVLHAIKHKICVEEEAMEVIYVCNAHNASMTIHKFLEFYNVMQVDQDNVIFHIEYSM